MGFLSSLVWTDQQMNVTDWHVSWNSCLVYCALFKNTFQEVCDFHLSFCGVFKLASFRSVGSMVLPLSGWCCVRILVWLVFQQSFCGSYFKFHGVTQLLHEIHESCHSVTFYSIKKISKWPCNTTMSQSIHTKDESKCRSAFAFIFGVNWPVQWM